MLFPLFCFLFFFNDTATTEIYTLSLHDALPILALQSLESNAQLSFATRMEDWTCLGLHKRHPEFPVVTRESRRNSRKTRWLHRHSKMKPFPATAPQEKSHVRNWRSKGHLAPLMRPTKFPEIPVSLERNTDVFRHPLL